MNISTGIVLPLLTREKSRRENDDKPVTLILGLYSYNSEAKTHNGDLLRVMLVKNGEKTSYHVDTVPLGAGVFHIVLALMPKMSLKGGSLGRPTEHTPGALLVCCTDGSIRLLSCRDGFEELDRVCRPDYSSDSSAMCTSCDLSMENSFPRREGKSFGASIRKLLRKVTQLFPVSSSDSESLWFPVSITRFIRSHRYVSSARVIATYSDGQCFVYACDLEGSRKSTPLSNFHAHDAEIWCSVIHTHIHESLVFSTGADDGAWKIWKYNIDSTEIELLFKIQLDAGVICIHPIQTPGKSVGESTGDVKQLVLVGSYDEKVRLYALSSSFHPKLISTVNVGGGPWRISQEFPSMSVNSHCTCAKASPDEPLYRFLVACMYSGYRILHYQSTSGLFLCENHQSVHTESKNLIDTANDESPELTYFAEWLPPQFGDSTAFATASYYRGRLDLHEG